MYSLIAVKQAVDPHTSVFHSCVDNRGIIKGSSHNSVPATLQTVADTFHNEAPNTVLLLLYKQHRHFRASLKDPEGQIFRLSLPFVGNRGISEGPSHHSVPAEYAQRQRGHQPHLSQLRVPA